MHQVSYDVIGERTAWAPSDRHQKRCYQSLLSMSEWTALAAGAKKPALVLLHTQNLQEVFLHDEGQGELQQTGWQYCDDNLLSIHFRRCYMCQVYGIEQLRESDRTFCNRVARFLELTVSLFQRRPDLQDPNGELELLRRGYDCRW